ncbi:MAG: NAD-glutamate dehydrogenase [Tessaracoccus sp.]|uniref:NAD-glutamate dehydrogenase n=1 Tax=Tessaracoccus sp. TaxID=1971211 RepID=UPI001EBCA972|nr:NAD-glutamate dehydrogenase [Tessaracoccus sp.]MBK7821004.1 NAD-glutamate dehydrogenase [Tessaracoccus sp.]
MTVLDERREALLAEAASGIDTAPIAPRELIDAYHRHVLTEDLAERYPDDIRGAVLSHLALARTRKPGEILVSGFTPRVDTHGWATGNTVLQVVTDDAPFIVDSVTAELDRQGHGVRLLIHPQLEVSRDAEGVLIGLGDGPRESWLHIEIGRVVGQDALDALITRVRAVLTDVATAVADWEPMVRQAVEVSAALAAGPESVPAAERQQVRDLLDWLVDDHFVFLGYRSYRYSDDDGVLEQVPGSGLGLMRGDSGTSRRALRGRVGEKAGERQLLIITKANSRSTVHRSVYLDYIGVKTVDENGVVNGEHRFIGLFTSNVYHGSVRAIPFLAAKVQRVMEASGFAPDSHSGKRLLNVLETYPRDELFQGDAEYLTDVARRIVASRYQRQTQLFARPDVYGRFTSCLVLLPRDRYNTDVRLRIQDILMNSFHGTGVEYTTRVDDSATAMVHYVIRRDASSAPPAEDLDDLQEWLRRAVQTWDSDWQAAMVAEFGEIEAARLVARWGGGLDEAYKAMHQPRMAAVDVRRLEELVEGIEASLYQEMSAHPGERRLRLYCDRALGLTEVLPLLLDFGLAVSDERTHRVVARDGVTRHILDFGVSAGDESWWAPSDGEGAGFLAAFLAVWERRAESDRFNQLIGSVRLTWRQVIILRMIAAYLRQTMHYSTGSLESALVENPDIARQLVDVFEARFLPGDVTDRDAREQAAADAVLAGVADVPSLDHDQMIRAFLAVIRAGERTNFYRPESGGAVAFKLDPQRVPHLPAPRPFVETWVYSTRLEGVHLRFGKVARGGLRWSDRRDDFRTEVLGLVKAQMVKNAVIVPTGAKGGFYPKGLPDPQRDRAAWLAQGRAAYREFVSALLSVTDNRVQGHTRGPDGVVRHDGDDSYLVVAADKGTAAFSDLANEVSTEDGFWLGDAFASGGSTGYDHKSMGITARGAWESVTRHFLERGTDPQTTDFTVVGVGDMSGDVFGNGMLLSEHIRLVAAFDHRHVFVDPTPDPATSFAERGRMFALPFSSWADYDTTLISAGGGVFPRSAKSIAITPEMRAALGLGDDEHLTPAELMTAILKAPVDLFWNGGIGTYVKASTEQHGEVGDRANDAVRVNGADLRCRVVGEGGNLGVTQRGRIEAAQRGIGINTDAIDNSGGVDSSDYEVNIKILLGSLLANGQMTERQRNDLLASMTNEVAASVLRTNYEQNVLLSNARHLGGAMLGPHERLMAWLEEHRGLDRALEALPSAAEMERRAKEGRGLTSPEFSVLVAYAKLALKDALLASTVPDDPWLESELAAYFPGPLRGFAQARQEHPLRREIIANRIANSVVNRGGITFAHRAMEESGAGLAEVAKAFVIAREVFDLRGFVGAVGQLDGAVPTAMQCRLYVEFRRLLDRTVRYLLARRPQTADIGSEIEAYRGTVQQLAATITDLYDEAGLVRYRQRVADFAAGDAPDELAARTAGLLDGVAFLGVVDLARQVDLDPELVARGYLHLAGVVGLDDLLEMLARLSSEGRWDAVAKSALRQDLYRLTLSLTADALSGDDAEDPAERVRLWATRHTTALAGLRATLGDLQGESAAGLGQMWVLVRDLGLLTGAPE